MGEARKCKKLVYRCQKCRNYIGKSQKERFCPFCGADRACGKYEVPGYDFCENHGGPAPSRDWYGRGNRIKNGTNSKFPLLQLASRFQDIQSDARIQSNRPLIQIVQARIVQLLDRLDANETPDRLKRLYELWQAFRNAPNGVEETKNLHLLDKEFDKVYHDYESWKQIMDAMSLHKDLTAAELKIFKELQAILTAEDAYNMVAQLMAAILKHVDDPKTILRIQYEFTRIVGVGNRAPLGGSGDSVIEVGPGGLDSEEFLDT